MCFNSKYYKGFKISFDLNDGSDIRLEKARNGDIISEPDLPQRNGYTFVAWYIDGEENEFDFSEPVFKSVKLIAKWNLIEYSVIFKDDDNIIDTQKYTIEDTPYSITLTPETKAGKIFAGWYSDSEFNSSEVKTLPVGFCDNLILYAKWF